MNEYKASKTFLHMSRLSLFAFRFHQCIASFHGEQMARIVHPWLGSKLSDNPPKAERPLRCSGMHFVNLFASGWRAKAGARGDGPGIS